MPELSGGALSIRVSPETGGELRAIDVLDGGRRRPLLYPGGPAWRGGAPWLFPAVGRTAGGKMPIHGLVMDRPWELLPSRARTIVCRVEDDAGTRALYPFGFRLTAEYFLDRGAVVARALVEAKPGNEGPMPFCLGNHLAFALPLLGEGEPGALRVRTPARELLELASTGFLTGRSEPAPFSRAVPLGADPRLRDLVVAGYEPAECWTELVSLSGRAVRVSQRSSAAPEALRFVYWSDGEEFFCAEPWLGEPDSLSTGRGLTRLSPGARFAWELRVSVAA